MSVKLNGPKEVRLAYYLGWKALLFAKFCLKNIFKK